MIYLHHGIYYPSLITLLTAIKQAQEEAKHAALWLEHYNGLLPHYAS